MDHWPDVLSAKLIRAHEFELVDEMGVVRASLRFRTGKWNTMTRQPVFQLLFRERDSILQMSPWSLTVSDFEGRRRLGITLFPDPGVFVYDGTGNEVARMAWVEGEGVVTVTGSDGVQHGIPTR